MEFMKDRKGIALLAVSTAFLVTACGTTEVNSLSQSTFSVSASYGQPFGGWERAQREAVAKAQAFCAAKGQVYSFSNEQRTGVPGFSVLTSTITFGCGEDTAALYQASNAECRVELQAHELDPIRSKVEVFRESVESSPPFEIAANDSFPTEEERPVIAKWATIRESCQRRADAVPYIPPGASAIRVTFLQQERSFNTAPAARINDLIVSLYQQKLTYGEFAKKRYEITRDAADAERQYRQSMQLNDQQAQMQAQQLAQQQFQNNLAAWSTYMQSVNARQPQSVHLEGTVRVQSNCTSLRTGNMTSTNCN